MIALAFFCVACGSDEDSGDVSASGTTEISGASDINAAEQEGGDAEGASMGTPGPPGCYDLAVHMCDCSLTEMACAEMGRIWTERCNCSEEEVSARGDGETAETTPSDAAASDAAVSAEGDADESMSSETDGNDVNPGCYDTNVHMCDCSRDQSACESAGQTWTEHCECRDGVTQEESPSQGDQGNSEAEGDSDQSGGRPGPEGCYDPTSHMCDCDIDEAACAESGGLWVPGCTSCGP